MDVSTAAVGERPPWLEMARRIAYDAHAGQTDKAGAPYVQAHVAEVAARVRHFGPVVEAVAWLHDVVEDTEFTLDDLCLAQMPREVIDAVDAITRRDGEPGDDYYLRVRANHDAWRVKVFGDIPSNTDPVRLAALPAETRQRLERKYAHALDVLIAGAA